jgi:hypothetical protein
LSKEKSIGIERGTEESDEVVDLRENVQFQLRCFLQLAKSKHRRTDNLVRKAYCVLQKVTPTELEEIDEQDFAVWIESTLAKRVGVYGSSQANHSVKHIFFFFLKKRGKKKSVASGGRVARENLLSLQSLNKSRYSVTSRTRLLVHSGTFSRLPAEQARSPPNFAASYRADP